MTSLESFRLALIRQIITYLKDYGVQKQAIDTYFKQYGHGSYGHFLNDNSTVKEDDFKQFLVWAFALAKAHDIPLTKIQAPFLDAQVHEKNGALYWGDTEIGKL